MLWFLPAILLPVIIHLLSKRKARRVDFSSLRFLRALEQDALKTFNIKQLILLILRTLIVLLLVLAFARPTIQKGAGFRLATRPQTLTLVVIDNTASTRTAMAAAQYQTWIKDFQKMSSQQSDLFFLGLGDSVLTQKPEEIGPTWFAPAIKNVARFAREHLPLDDYARRECILITDGQFSTTLTDSLSPEWWTAVLKFENVPDQGLTAIHFPQYGFQPGDEYPLRVQAMTNESGLSDEAVELWINDRRVNQILLTSPNKSQENFVLKGLVEGRLSQEGTLKLSPDANSYNDSRYYVIQPGGKVHVGVLAQSQQPNIWEILKTLLSEQAYNIEFEIADVNNPDALALSKLKTLIWDTQVGLSSHQLDRLRQFMLDGGQIILVGAVNQAVASAFEIPRTSRGETETDGFPLNVTRLATTVFPDLPLRATLDNGRLTVKKRFLADEPLMKKSQTWLAFADELPLLDMMNFGKGRLVRMNTTFDPDDSNWPVLGIFPALLVKIIHLAVPEMDMALFNRNVGDHLFFPRLVRLGTDPYQVQLPGSQSQYIQPDSAGRIIFTESIQPGFYRLFRGAQRLSSIAVNIDPREAQPQSLTIDTTQLTQFHMVLSGEADLTQQILANRQGTPLWPWILLLALVIYFAENLIARIPRGWRQ